MIESYTLHSRQRELVAPALQRARILVYGTGMLGSWTAIALARITEYVEVWDGGDMVEDVNLGTQAYSDADVGRPKGDSLCNKLLGFNVMAVDKLFPPVNYRPKASYFALQGQSLPDVVIACADSMDARRNGEAWAFGHSVPLFIDTRARGLEATILTVTMAEHNRYSIELPSDDAIEPVPCGQNGTAFVGMFVAARVASILNCYFRDGIGSIPYQESWNVERNVPINIVYR